ncbi:MAG: hypothetical protein R2883_07030 [Caldisericia bacterium]
MSLDKMKIKDESDIIESKLQSACFGRTPENLALKALSLYDGEVKKKKKTRKLVTFLLFSLIPILAILLGVIFAFLDYDLSTILSWIFQSQMLVFLAYSIVIALSVFVMSILGKRIFQMRKSVNNIESH